MAGLAFPASPAFCPSCAASQEARAAFRGVDFDILPCALNDPHSDLQDLSIAFKSQESRPPEAYSRSMSCDQAWYGTSAFALE